MERRGKCVIIYNTLFESQTVPKSDSTLEDQERLSRCFEFSGFDVIKWGEKRANEIETSIDALAREDFSDYDCLVVCVLTRGEFNYLYARDGKYPVRYLIEAFDNDRCKTLDSKPKVFFIQAPGRTADSKIGNLYSHLLVASSNLPDSMYIKAFLTSMLKHFEKDLQEILTQTHSIVFSMLESKKNLPPGENDFPSYLSLLFHQIYFKNLKRKKTDKSE